MRLVAAVFTLLLALVAGMGAAVAAQAQPAVSESMATAPTTASAADEGMPAGIDRTAPDAAAVADLEELQSDPDDRTEAIACSAGDLPTRADASLPAAERPNRTPWPWPVRLLRPPRTAQG